MDNLTHSLFGMAVAEAYIQRKFRKSNNPKSIDKKTRLVLYGTSVIANNLPDTDLLTALVDNSHLGYLLNHRGWTHTVLGTLFLTILLWFSFRFFKKHTSSLSKDIFLLALLGGLTHILLDFFNAYGVHPFAPFNNHWFYLDTIFIIEPLLWICLLPLWIHSRKSIGTLAALVIGIYAFGWTRGLSSLHAMTVAVLFFAIIVTLAKKIPPKKRAYTALFIFFALVSVFWVHQNWAKGKIENYFASHMPKAQILDTVLFPLPSNPSRWFFLVPLIENSQYQIFAGDLSLYGPSDGSTPWPLENSLQPVTHPLPASSPHVVFLRSVWMPSQEEFRALLTRCDIRAWMRFVRVPYWHEGQLTDMRFALRNKINFSGMDSSQADTCPVLPAPWTPPRQDLLNFLDEVATVSP